MKSPKHDQPNPDAALLIDCGVGMPAIHVARIAKMHQDGAAGRAAIRRFHLGETEPATIFVPLHERTDANDE